MYLASVKAKHPEQLRTGTGFHGNVLAVWLIIIEARVWVCECASVSIPVCVNNLRRGHAPCVSQEQLRTGCHGNVLAVWFIIIEG